MVRGRTIIHAFIGAVVAVVLSFLPFSTVLGGAVAGFLEGSDGRDGALVGALAGTITFVPIAALAFLVLAIVGFGVSVAAAPLEGVALVMLTVAVLATIVLLYTVGLSLVGGYLGAYLAREYPEARANTRRTIGIEPRVAADDRRREWDRERRESWGSSETRDRRERREQRERRKSRDDPSQSQHSSDTFSPDPRERLDPTRWRASESRSDADFDPEDDSERDRESEREYEPDRGRE